MGLDALGTFAIIYKGNNFCDCDCLFSFSAHQPLSGKVHSNRRESAPKGSQFIYSRPLFRRETKNFSSHPLKVYPFLLRLKS